MSRIYYLVFLAVSVKVVVSREDVTRVNQDIKYEEALLALNMSVKAFEMVCWYEYAKQFPGSNGQKFHNCFINPDDGKTYILQQNAAKKYPEKIPEWFANQLGAYWTYLPTQYKYRCEKYLADIKASYDVNEGKILLDGDKKYPLKGYSYCFINTLKTIHGEEKVVNALEEYEEGRNGEQDWRRVMLFRENLMRERHGVPPLKLLVDLDKSAQAWAIFMAQICQTERSTDVNIFKGNVTLREPEYAGLKGAIGENSFAIKGKLDKYLAAYTAVNAWYDEIENYDFKTHTSINGNETSHFTTMIWKRAEYVGYGYSYDASCQTENTRVYAQYYPGGNVAGMYADNVFPPKD